MKNFRRKNQLFSLCGLNCSLCAMNLGGHCGGCGSERCQGCSIARCSGEHDHVQYCVECCEYPCSRYDGITEYDSFIVHRNQRKDLEKFKKVGEETYNEEQVRKRYILDVLLQNYNNGRKKNFYCIAVNLLETEELERIIRYINENEAFDKLTHKEQINEVTRMIQAAADAEGLVLKLRKKK